MMQGGMTQQTAKLQLQRKWASAKCYDVIKDVKEKRLHGLLVNAMLRFSKTAQMMVTLVVTACRGPASTAEAVLLQSPAGPPHLAATDRWLHYRGGVK